MISHICSSLILYTGHPDGTAFDGYLYTPDAIRGYF